MKTWEQGDAGNLEREESAYLKGNAMNEYLNAICCPACNLPPGGCQCHKWCDECWCLTNHTGLQHREAAAEQEDEGL